MRIHYDNEAHAADFIRLNEAWISEYFEIETADRELAKEPMRIVHDGGSIITLTERGNVIGACALFRDTPGRYQLARMAVERSEQGKGWGGMLVELALVRARQLSASSVYLLSNTRLQSAIHLYRKHGFQVVHLGLHPVYARCNIVMERQVPLLPPSDE